MAVPENAKKGVIVQGAKKAPVFRTASGALVEAKQGARVGINDVSRMVDICVAFDTTGSMSDKISGLTDCMVEFIAELSKLKLDWRFSLVPFGDLTVPGDKVVGNLKFTNNRQDAQSMIMQMPRFGGGGNQGESSLEAMTAAMAKDYRRGAVKVIVLLTDDWPLQSAQLTTKSVSDGLRRKEFVCFIASNPQQGYEEMATANAGKWYPIGSSMDTSGMMGFLRGLLKDVAKVSKAVHDFGGGSVSKYILTENSRKALGG